MGDCVHLCFTEKEAPKGLDLDQGLSLPESVLKLSQNLHSRSLDQNEKGVLVIFTHSFKHSNKY